MPMNKQSGNMYGFVTHTWNPIRGCGHNCSYCYVPKKFNGRIDMTPRLDETEFKTDLGSGNFIFVGSTSDMFGDFMKNEWILKVLKYCRKYPGNRYLFQSKNPESFLQLEIQQALPEHSILGTTMESNRDYPKITDAPSPMKRYVSMKIQTVFPKMVSIEPILNFDLDTMIHWVKGMHPIFVSIGADSKKTDLPEPTAQEINELVTELRKHTEVILKDNLRRIYKQEEFI